MFFLKKRFFFHEIQRKLMSNFFLWSLLSLFWLSIPLFLTGCIDQRGLDSRKNRQLSSKERQLLKKFLLKKAPHPLLTFNATLSSAPRSSAIFFYGIDIKPNPVKRGESVTITSYFKSLKNFRKRWRIFLHLEAEPSLHYFKNLDHSLVKGLYPTTRWKKGQIIKDVYTFKIPKDFPGQFAYLYSGFWYRNRRMNIPSNLPNDKRGRLLIAKIKVRGPSLKRPIYVAYRVKNPPKIDGKLDDAVWKKAPSTGPFRTHNNRQPHFRTEAKIVWDKHYLYIAFYCEDDDIWTTYKKRDDPLFKQENVEFFIDANRNYKDYIELQVSPAGVIFDSFFKTYRRPRPWGDLSYNSEMLVKVHRNGTLNDKSDKDKSWSVEMRLPFKKLGPALHLPPWDGDEWLINMYRLERSRLSVKEDHAWSPVTLSRYGDYHQIRRFGTLRFSKKFLSEHKKKSLQPAQPHKTSFQPKAVLAPKELRKRGLPRPVKRNVVHVQLGSKLPPNPRMPKVHLYRFKKKSIAKSYKCPPKKKQKKPLIIKPKLPPLLKKVPPLKLDKNLLLDPSLKKRSPKKVPLARLAHPSDIDGVLKPLYKPKRRPPQPREEEQYYTPAHPTHPPVEARQAPTKRPAKTKAATRPAAGSTSKKTKRQKKPTTRPKHR